MGIPRMRIATDVLAEIKALDPDTRITLHYIRGIINQGKVPVRKAGTKKLVDLDKSGEWSCESGLCQHLPQMREMPPIHPAPL